MSSSLKARLQTAIAKFKTDKIRLWKTITLFSIVLFLFASSSFLWHALSKRPAPNTPNAPAIDRVEPRDEPSQSPCEGCVRRSLDGVWVKDAESNLPLVAVMIDNHPSARPAKGIDRAGVVYEAEVEGNYTRFMAVFSGKEGPKEIGPVRSARSYFLDWAAELGAVYSHCGGSPDALAKIVQRDIVDLNEFYNGQYYWRDNGRTAPHNVTTSWKDLEKFLENSDMTSGDFKPWKFKVDSPKESATSSMITINYNHPEFKVQWLYDKEGNDYIRLSDGKEQRTYDDRQLRAKNLLIQIIPAKVVDEKLRLDMDPIGKGPATICLDGECQEGEWAKDGFRERTIFSLANGKEVELNAGQTWVEVVRPEVEVIY